MQHCRSGELSSSLGEGCSQSTGRSRETLFLQSSTDRVCSITSFISFPSYIPFCGEDWKLNDIYLPNIYPERGSSGGDTSSLRSVPLSRRHEPSSKETIPSQSSMTFWISQVEHGSSLKDVKLSLLCLLPQILSWLQIVTAWLLLYHFAYSLRLKKNIKQYRQSFSKF